MTGIRTDHALRTALAVLVCVALVLGVVVAVGQVRGQAYLADGRAVPVDVPAITAVLDSPVGHGADLEPGVAREIGAGPDAGLAHSALVRVSAFEAAADTVITAGGAPALHVAAGSSGSSTVLLPLSEGTFTLVSSAAIAARAEVLATFGGAHDVPGSTIALGEAVSRPADGAALTAAPGAPAQFGLVGLGGLPASDVRAVHVSLTVAAEVATVLDVGGQSLPVGAGTTTLSTIVTPSGEDGLEVRSEASVSVSLAVRGWVAGAAQYTDGLNGPGSFWPEVLAEPLTQTVHDTEPAPVDLGARADAGHVLALVWAEPAVATTTLELGDVPLGRARGALVDPERGAQPQLVVVPAQDPFLTLRRGSTAAGVLPVGTLVGEEVVESSRPATITVDSPEPDVLELEAQITFTFRGRVDAGDTTPLRVEVSRDGRPWGLASIVPGHDGVTWTYQAAFAESAQHDFTFTLVGRDESAVSTGWSAGVTVPGDDELVLTEDVVPLGWPGTDQEIVETAEGWVDFGEEPGFTVGDVIAGAAGEGSPDGLLRRVRAIDVLPDRWRVHTDPATFTDVFLQVERHAVLPAVQPGGPLPEIEVVEPAEGAEPAVGTTTAEFVRRDQVDLGPLENDAELEAEMDDGAIDEPPTEWNFPGAAGVAPMAVPVPQQPRPTDPTGPSSPPPGRTAPSEGESDSAGWLGWTFDEKGSTTGLEYEMFLRTSFAAEFGFNVDLRIETRWTDWWGIVPPAPYPVVAHFEAVLTTKARVDVEGSLRFTGVWRKEYKADVLAIKFSPVTLFIGPVPVVINFSLNAQLQAHIGIAAQFQLSFQSTTRVEHRLGFRYGHDDGASLVNENETSYGDPVMGDAPTAEGALSAQAGPELSVRILLYDSAGPTIGFGLKAGLDMQAQLHWDGMRTSAELYLQGNLFLRVTAKVPVIDLELTEFTLIDVPFRWTLHKWTDHHPDDPDPGPTEEPTEEPSEEPTEEPSEEPTEEPTEEPIPGDAMDALEFASAIDATEFWWDGEYDLRFLPVAVTGAEWVDGPPAAEAVGIVEGDYSLPENPASYDEDSYPVLSTGHRRSFFEDSQEAFGVRSSRGDDLWDSTTLRIDFDRPPAAQCASISYLFGSDDIRNGDHGDALVFEWGRHSWSTDGTGAISAPDSVIRQVNADSNYFSDVVRAESDTFYNFDQQNTRFRFDATAAMHTSFQLPADGSSSLYVSLADVGSSDGTTAVAIESIVFYPDYECGTDYDTTQTWRSFNGQG